MGLPLTGMRGLGLSSVSGRRRRPLQPLKIIAFKVIRFVENVDIKCFTGTLNPQTRSSPKTRRLALNHTAGAALQGIPELRTRRAARLESWVCALRGLHSLLSCLAGHGDAPAVTRLTILR